MSWIDSPNLYVFDCEVFAHDWFFVFKNHNTGEKTKIHNDSVALKMFMGGKPLLCGFNNKHYDEYIIKAVCNDFSPEAVKQVSDKIIAGENGFNIQFGERVFIQGFDLRDDMQQGTSLKSIEGALFMNIQETEVDFNIDRALTEKECEDTFFYCGCDVDATERLMILRQDYLDAKVEIGDSCELTPEKSLSYTNAKIVAKLLDATPQKFGDERVLVLPSEVNYEYVPKGLADFFMQVNDKSISDAQLFDKNFVCDIGGCPCTFKWGGCHGAIECYHAQSSGDVAVQDRDVSSLYPSLLIEYNLISRAASHPERLDEARQKRFSFKKVGDKKHATQWKLPLNTVSGAQDNKYNDLYDPHNTLTMRITGQLLVSELVNHLCHAIPSFHLFNLNTDGFMYEVGRNDTEKVDEICAEWQKRARLSLEVNPIDRLWQKDVNNVLTVTSQGRVEGIGSYLTSGISLKGAWSINNNMIVVKNALIAYFTYGTEPEAFVEKDNDIKDYQIISKMGSGFDSSYQIIKGSRHSVQKVNRCYAYKDVEYGTIFKVRANGSEMKIADLPDHLIIDNDNHLSIDAVDKSWYVSVIRSHINDFLGASRRKRKVAKPQKEEQLSIFMANEEEVKAEPEKVPAPQTPTGSAPIQKADEKPAEANPEAPAKAKRGGKTEAKPLGNVYAKLNQARLEYLTNVVKPSGRNVSSEYLYYQLADIEPYIIPIFRSIGIIDITWFDNEYAHLDIIDCDDPTQHIEFKSPMLPASEFKSLTGKSIATPIQGLGAIETYERRYLILVAMGIAVPDDVEAWADVIHAQVKPKNEGGAPEVVADTEKPKEPSPKDEKKPEAPKEPKKPETPKVIVAPGLKKPRIPPTSVERKEITKTVCANDGDASPEQIAALKEALQQLHNASNGKENSYIMTIAVGTNHFQKVTKGEAERYLAEIKPKLESYKKEGTKQ